MAPCRAKTIKGWNREKKACFRLGTWQKASEKEFQTGWEFPESGKDTDSMVATWDDGEKYAIPQYFQSDYKVDKAKQGARTREDVDLVPSKATAEAAAEKPKAAAAKPAAEALSGAKPLLHADPSQLYI